MTTDLTPRQLAICLGYGAAFWLIAALLLGRMAPAGWLDGWARAGVFVLVVPGSVPVVLLLRRLAALGRGQLLGGMAVATAAAMLLDGVALSWAPVLYGGAAHVAGSGATILWGAGVLIFLAYALDRPARPHPTSG
jgi:hypothetical protein